MLDVDPRVRDELKRLLPLPDEGGADWRSVLARVNHPRGARRRAKLAITGAGLVVAALVAALAWPFVADRGGVLERALAAADDGAVLHVVFRYDRPIDTILDLASGERRDNVYPVSELWYDRDRGVRYVGRIGDIVVHDDVDAAVADDRLDTYVLLARSYRDALASGRARVVGPGEVDGRAVFWISVWEASSRSVIDGKVTFHRVAQEVAVSQESYEPVASRSTLGGKPDSRTLVRIVEFETLPADEVEFERPSPPGQNEPHAFLCCRTEPIPLEQARSVIGRAPLWLDDEFRDLAFAASLASRARRERKANGSGRERSPRSSSSTAC